MAARYKAVTRIKTADSEGKEKYFEPGDTVSGFTKDQMTSLWDAGALEEVGKAGDTSTTETSTAGGTGSSGGGAPE